MDKTKLGALFYPVQDQLGREIPFDSLFIPYIYKEIYFEGVYIDVLNQKKDMVIVDVGANIGVTVDYFRRYAKKLYAIEPSPEHFAALKKNKEFNNWDNVELFNYALADHDGEMSFAQNSGNRTMNTLMDSGQKDKHGHVILTDGISDRPMIKARDYQEGIKVPVKSIDQFFKEAGITHVDFMKFDPEGAEDMILRSEGFKKVAHMIDNIEVEFHFSTWGELVNYMVSLGYKARQYDSSAHIVLFFR